MMRLGHRPLGTQRAAAMRFSAHRARHPFSFDTAASVPSGLATKSPTVSQLTALHLADAKQRHHVGTAHQHLQHHGILKINVGFPDPDSQYLKQLVLSFHDYHGHQLPISHSASRGWFWDVRPSVHAPFQAAQYRARSETTDGIPWHTDCSYEDLPPRYFALHVLQHDRFGGGTLSFMDVQSLAELLSPDTRASLMRQDYRIRVPTEFVKEPEKQEIVGSVMASRQNGQPCMMRFREEITTPLTERASRAMQELDSSLRDAEAQEESTIHFTAMDLSAGSIILVDNRRWLHARNDIKDPERHLRRVRWDAAPF
ncbi:hypothetical protein E4U41_005796 [Claviceps citrina]|nr:hypothetical protein E4U41_005796 [Claviceps citrina]